MPSRRARRPIDWDKLPWVHTNVGPPHLLVEYVWAGSNQAIQKSAVSASSSDCDSQASSLLPHSQRAVLFPVFPPTGELDGTSRAQCDTVQEVVPEHGTTAPVVLKIGRPGNGQRDPEGGILGLRPMLFAISVQRIFKVATFPRSISSGTSRGVKV